MTTMTTIAPADCPAFVARAQEGDKRAEAALVANFEKLAWKVARREHREGVELDDLAQTSRMAILDAIRCFDADKGTPFIIVAQMRMRAQCQKVIRANRPTSGDTRVMRAMFTGLPKAKADLHSVGKAITPANLAAHMGFEVTEVADAMGAASPHATSMESPVRGKEGDKGTFVETLTSAFMGQEERLQRVQLSSQVREIVEALHTKLCGISRKDRLATILEGRIIRPLNGEDALTTAVIGEGLGLTKQRVGQLEGDLRRLLAKRLESLRG